MFPYLFQFYFYNRTASVENDISLSIFLHRFYRYFIILFLFHSLLFLTASVKNVIYQWWCLLTISIVIHLFFRYIYRSFKHHMSDINWHKYFNSTTKCLFFSFPSRNLSKEKMLHRNYSIQTILWSILSMFHRFFWRFLASFDFSLILSKFFCFVWYLAHNFDVP